MRTSKRNHEVQRAVAGENTVQKSALNGSRSRPVKRYPYAGVAGAGNATVISAKV